MALPDQRIIDFIGEHHILNLAVSRNNIPYCATCYYAYMKEENQFVFTSAPDTRHVRDLIEGNNYRVAGTIALETRIVGKIRGIQFTGIISPGLKPGANYPGANNPRQRYLKRFPIARLMPELHLWILTPDFLKLTDNRLGFGTKLTWRAG